MWQTQKHQKYKAKKQSERRKMIVNLYIDGEHAELLEALADHDGVTVEEKANAMFEDLMNKTIQALKDKFFN